MILCILPVSIAGYATMANVASATVRFGMTCLMAIGMYASVPCILVWNSNNSAGHYKRATTSALQLGVANAGGFVASGFLFPFSPLHFFFLLACPVALRLGWKSRS
jgi:predicted sugar kinase